MIIGKLRESETRRQPVSLNMQRKLPLFNMIDHRFLLKEKFRLMNHSFYVDLPRNLLTVTRFLFSMLSSFSTVYRLSRH